MGRFSGMEISWANYWGFFNPRDEEISVPENHGPFGNCIPVWIYICANWAFHIVLTFFFKKIMKLSQFAINFMIFSKKIVKTCRFTEFLHGGSCGNQISAWGVMQKSDSFSVVLWRFHEFFYRYRNLSMTIAYIDSYRNNHFWVNFWHTKWTLKTQSSYIEIAQFTKRTAVSLKHINFIDKINLMLSVDTPS